MKNILFACALALTTLVCHAGDTEMPSTSMVDSKVRELSQSGFMPTDDLLEAKQRELRPEIDNALKTAPAPAQVVPYQFAVPDFYEPPVKKYDPMAAVKLYEKITSPDVNKKAELILFVSFGMPENSLKSLLAQAADYGAVVVLRGLKDGVTAEGKLDFRPTHAAIKALGMKDIDNLQINPPAFTRFKVNVVPTLVLADASDARNTTENGCAPEVSYVSVSGDISIEYGLQLMARKAQGAIAKTASDMLRKGRIDAGN